MSLGRLRNAENKLNIKRYTLPTVFRYSDYFLIKYSNSFVEEWEFYVGYTNFKDGLRARGHRKYYLYPKNLTSYQLAGFVRNALMQKYWNDVERYKETVDVFHVVVKKPNGILEIISSYEAQKLREKDEQSIEFLHFIA